MLTIEEKMQAVLRKWETAGQVEKKIFIPELDSIMHCTKHCAVLFPYECAGYLPGDIAIDRNHRWYTSICDARPVHFDSKKWLKYKEDPRVRVYICEGETVPDDYYICVREKYIRHLMHRNAFCMLDVSRGLLWLMNEDGNEPFALVCCIRAMKRFAVLSD